MSFENVILTYPHPHVVVFVQDNTVYTETFLEAEAPVRFIQCGPFASGRDNVLLYYTRPDEMVNELGNLNYKLYGQAGYNAYAALSTGYAAGYIMRIMPDDATYANTVIMVKYKVDDAVSEFSDGPIVEGETVISPKKLYVDFFTQTITGGTDATVLETAYSALTNRDPDDEGYYTRPLMLIRQSGRGIYGNGTRVRFGDDTAYDDPETTYHTYRLDVLEMKSTLMRTEFAYGSFNEDLFDAATGTSLYLMDLVNDDEEGLTKVRIDIDQGTLGHIVQLYNTMDSNDQRTTSNLDIIFGRNLDGTTNEMIVYETSDATVDITSAEGINLFSGEDGAFDVSNPDRDKAITECLIKAYNGDYDRSILSRFSSPADFQTDANFDLDVKKAMAKLAIKREWDCMTYLDTGMLSTTSDIINWGNNNRSVLSANNILNEMHNYKIRDTKFTGKTIPVTSTYKIAAELPIHIKTKGIGEAFAQENCRITNAVKNTFLPVINPDDDDIKKELYNLRFNCYEAVSVNTYQRSTAITTQAATSDRLDEFNEYILHLAVKTAYDIMHSKIYKLGEEDHRAAYKTEADRVLQYKLGPYVRSVSVNFTMSKDDERKNIMRLVLRIVYRTVVKRGIVEIYLDPRA